MKSPNSTALLLLASLLVSTLAPAADWPQYLGAKGDGTTPEAVRDRPEVAWQKNFGTGISQVVTGGGRAFTMGNSENETAVICFDPATGEEIWSHRYFSPTEKNNFGSGRTPFPGGPTSTPAVSAGRVYSVSRFGHVHCLEAATGKVVWEREFKRDFPAHTLPTWGYSASPFLSGGRLYLEPGGKGHSCVALDAKTGATVWQEGDDAAGYATPRIATVGGKPTLVTFNAFGLVGRDPENGAEFFRKRWKTEYGVNAAQPIVVNRSNIFISSGYGTGAAMLQLGDGGVKTAWETKRMRNKHTVSLLLGSHLYGFDEGVLRCIAAADGKSAWQKKGYGKGALTATGGGKAVVQAENGTLAIARLSPEGIDILSEQTLFSDHHSWTAPSVSDGRIFARDVAGNTVCLK